MRVTQSMLANNFLRNLSTSYERMGKYQDQLTTGKKVNRPSDDPVVAMKGMNYRTQLKEIEQYQRNLGEIQTWMDNSDDALDKSTKVLQRLRELATQASNGTYDAGQRANIAEEVKELRNHMVEIANTKVNNKYIFNGTDTTNPRFDKDGLLIANPPNDEGVNIAVSDGITLKSNINPSNVFSEELFAELENFADALENPASTEDDIAGYLGKIDQFANNVVDERANLGARTNRLEMVEDRLSAQKIVATKVLSENEDIDYEKVITDLLTQESVHRAALSAGSRIIQPTLIDFLR
ncbi:flagellar hook-associated protein 3 FlgL [Salirhabdus euzebyi]|uniref:Flagellar hook-associated protein 3 FlgL n=1 Tax=Salirhabdus euzebyi TaxID=394506 RepID=A0A841Q5G1_9BACI|nr:flagellar hook-associated protein FlgL [Salirhabdus euzebyi]MBB6453628.1 flagellar hook-associated protein 3 FlgL [Salirhabdus euzebyi]